MKKHIFHVPAVLIAVFLGLIANEAIADSAVPFKQYLGQAGLLRAAHLSKASTPLVRLLSEFQAHAARGGQSAFQPTDKFLPFAAGRVLVEASASADGAALLEDLKRLGLREGKHYGTAVSGLLPVNAIEPATMLSSLRSISAVIPPVRNAGSITSQGDIALRSVFARNSYAVNGSGVTVGVISDSFDTFGGASADIVSGDLPSSGVTVVGGESVYCGVYVYCIDEGRAMAQIVYDMAPGAEILFHTGYATKPDYANAITTLAAAGADIIVDDLLYLNEPMFQDGVVAQAVDSVAANGVVYFAAAGNAGSKSYEAPFRDSGTIFCIEFFEPIGDCHALYERVGRMHDFDPGPGVDLYQDITVPVDSVLTVALQWDAPFGNGTGARNDHDIVLLDQTGNYYFEISANDNVTTGEGWEVLQFQNAEVLDYGTEFSLIITYDDVDSVAPPATLLKTVIFSSGATINEHHTNSSTLFGHVNAEGAIATGAAFFSETPEFGVNPPQIQPYSAKGGTPILFGQNGRLLTTPLIRSKPEITAVDGVNTTFFFDDLTGNDGIDDFFGTSAAAPHAAGVAALLLEARSGATPDQIKAALQSSAIDMNSLGFDPISGYGLIQADAAIAALLAAGDNIAPDADFTFTTNDLGVTFTDASTDVDGSIVNWNWDFGDGNSGATANPIHTYASAGSYTVALTVTDNEGGVASQSKPVTVSTSGADALPTASFSYACNGRTCDFDASASTDDVAINSYSWSFGDGSGSTGAIVNHTYPANGAFVITLVVTDTASQSSTAVASVRLKNRGGASGTSTSDGGGGGGDTGTTIEAEKGRKKCSDGIDNDGDGLIDGDDPDCA